MLDVGGRWEQLGVVLRQYVADVTNALVETQIGQVLAHLDRAEIRADHPIRAQLVQELRARLTDVSPLELSLSFPAHDCREVAEEWHAASKLLDLYEWADDETGDPEGEFWAAIEELLPSPPESDEVAPLIEIAAGTKRPWTWPLLPTGRTERESMADTMEQTRSRLGSLPPNAVDADTLPDRPEYRYASDAVAIVAAERWVRARESWARVLHTIAPFSPVA